MLTKKCDLVLKQLYTKPIRIFTHLKQSMKYTLNTVPIMNDSFTTESAINISIKRLSVC